MVILTQIAKIRVRTDRAQLLEHAETARRAAEKAASLTRQLLAFGRKQVLVLQVLDLNELLEEVKGNAVHPSVGAGPADNDAEFGPLPVKVDPERSSK